MILRLGMAPRRPGMSTVDFLEHWRTSHADAAGQIPNLQRYVQLHPVLQNGVHALGYPGFDACSELEFASVEAMEEGFASETYQVAVRADEDAFIDKGRFCMVLGERERLSGQRREEGVRLLAFLRKHPAVSVEELDAVVSGPFAGTIAADEQVVGLEVLRPLDQPRPGRERAACELVVGLDLPDREGALSWVGSEAAVAADLHLAGYAFGVTRLLAEEYLVV